ncbi:hypothetical protein DH2020_018964 [Rehmannia glutinosa]|uniref:SWI/SNF complex subunit SWI3A n=1 Tax=Rehmannia glutinosa TaxID=99300 RepID=A0ABR0WKI5_REHGL
MATLSPSPVFTNPLDRKNEATISHMTSFVKAEKAASERDGPRNDGERWFSWINIHEVERFSLREFFDGSSVTRSPRIYKEYRDFIISKYREDPSRKLTFTEVRKSLVGDISVLLKVFTFLEKWGLINFNVTDNNEKLSDDGGVRTASSGRHEEEENWGVGESGFKWPPLASYLDVYGELMQQEKKKGLVCGSCKDGCDSAHYEYTKSITNKDDMSPVEESFILCEKCFKSGNYVEDKLADDFKLKESVNQAAVWTEAETSLLLESVLKHGDDWDLVAKNVQTKNKLECIAKLIQLPFGDLMLGLAIERAEDPSPELQDKDQQNGDAENEGSPRKKVCTGPTSDVGSSLMKEVARISTMLGPHVTASAAEAAVTSLCYENQCSREIFDDDGNYVDSIPSPETSNQMRAADADHAVEDVRPNQSEIQETSSSVKNIIPLNLRTRAATATALGAAAANAKLLADQEEREIAHLVASMIEVQLKKLRRKMKYFEDLELIMEKEYTQLEELEESLVAQRMNALEMVFTADITKSKEHNTLMKYQTDTVQ